MNIINTNTLRDIPGPGVLSKSLLDVGKARALLLNLDADQAVAPCKMSFIVIYYFIEGQGQIQVEDKQAEFQKGSLVAVPAGAERRISASHKTSALVIQIL